MQNQNIGVVAVQKPQHCTMVWEQRHPLGFGPHTVGTHIIASDLLELHTSSPEGSLVETILSNWCDLT